MASTTLCKVQGFASLLLEFCYSNLVTYCLFTESNVSVPFTSKVRRRFLQKKSLDQDALKSFFEDEILPNHEWLTYLASQKDIMSFIIIIFYTL